MLFGSVTRPSPSEGVSEHKHILFVFPSTGWKLYHFLSHQEASLAPFAGSWAPGFHSREHVFSPKKLPFLVVVFF